MPAECDLHIELLQVGLPPAEAPRTFSAILRRLVITFLGHSIEGKIVAVDIGKRVELHRLLGRGDDELWAGPCSQERPPCMCQKAAEFACSCSIRCKSAAAARQCHWSSSAVARPISAVGLFGSSASALSTASRAGRHAAGHLKIQGLRSRRHCRAPRNPSASCGGELRRLFEELDRAGRCLRGCGPRSNADPGAYAL